MTKEAFPEGLRDEVLERDKVCFLFRRDPSHICRTRFNQRHRPDDRRFLTLDHVKQKLRMSGAKRHRAWLLVAMCGYENNRPPSAETRKAERDYLRKIYPEQWAGVP